MNKRMTEILTQGVQKNRIIRLESEKCAPDTFSGKENI